MTILVRTFGPHNVPGGPHTNTQSPNAFPTPYSNILTPAI